MINSQVPPLRTHGLRAPAFVGRALASIGGRRRARQQRAWGRLHAALTAVFGCVVIADPAMAQPSLTPSAVFVQAGAARQTREVTAGLVWDWTRQWNLGSGQVTGYWEASLSLWSYPGADERRTAWLGQASLIPVFRFRPTAGTSPWFFEGGVGVTLMTTIYETDRKQFSTSFNFADHLGFGRNFGSRREHEIALRLEHFSNGGIRHPNPGESFAQIRYLFRFD